MSSEARPTTETAEDVATLSRRRAALRLAFGVTCSFVFAEALDWNATFLGPVLAAQLLVKMTRLPTLAQGFGIVILIAATMFGVLFLSTALFSNPTTLILCLGLLHYLAFYAHIRGAPEFPTLMLQTAGVAIPVFVVVSPSVAAGFAMTLVSAGVVAIFTVWGAFAAFPAPADSEKTPIDTLLKVESPNAAAKLALLKTLILMPVLTWFVLDASQTATVVLIMILTILRLVDPHMGWRTAFGLIVANLLGGVAATVAYNVIKVGGSITALAIVILCLSLLFAGRIVTARENASVFTIAFAAFILLLGSGLSPLPGGSEEAAITRVMNVVLATAYAAGALSLFQAFHLQAQKE
jgi:hypothetical protein